MPIPARAGNCASIRGEEEPPAEVCIKWAVLLLSKLSFAYVHLGRTKTTSELKYLVLKESLRGD